MKPLLIVQMEASKDVADFRMGLRGCEGVIALGLNSRNFEVLAGLDALFLTLPRAEAWGSKPLPPHTCEVLKTRDTEAQKGFPAYAVTGVVLTKNDPQSGQFVLPLVVRSALTAVLDFNKDHAGAISILGLSDVARFAPDCTVTEMGELVRAGYQAAQNLR